MSYTGNRIYSFDRWILEDVTTQAMVTVTDTGITFSLPSSAPDQAWLTQYRETPFDGETHTVSVDVESKTGYVSLWAGGNNIGETVWSDGVTSLTGKLTGTMAARIAIVPGSSVAIKRTKLELGPISTLMYDAPPDMAVELAKCQRYQLKLGKNCGIGRADTSTVIYAVVPLPVTLRTWPTVTGTFGVWPTSGTQVTSVSINSVTDNAVCLNVLGSGFVVDRTYTVWYADDAFLDANIY